MERSGARRPRSLRRVRTSRPARQSQRKPSEVRCLPDLTFSKTSDLEAVPVRSACWTLPRLSA
jgi:hypothetical protein